MKKLLFVSLFIICAFAASAQWSIAPELGLSAFSHNNGGSDGWRPAVKAGAAVEYAFRPHFSLESGLYYTQRGYSLAGRISIPDDWDRWEFGPERPSLVRHLLQVPIRARFSWEIAEDTRFFVSAGAYVGAYFANDWKQTTIMQGADYGKAFDWGVTATVGIEVKRWFFRLGYDISLAKEYDDGISPKYHVGTISIGYKF